MSTLTRNLSIFLVLLVIAAIAILLGVNQTQKTNKGTASVEENQSHQASLVEPFELSNRGVIFNVKSKGEPNFNKLVFDPLEARPGEMQKMRLGIKNGAPLKEVEAEITCGIKKTVAFQQTKNGEQMELWQATVKIPKDAKTQQCTAVFKAVDQNKVHNQYTFRWQLNQ
ncbi:MAG: hypothetical protein V5A57_01885 [Candidatus Paceibacterota bacterium]